MKLRHKCYRNSIGEIVTPPEIKAITPIQNFTDYCIIKKCGQITFADEIILQKPNFIKKLLLIPVNGLGLMARFFRKISSRVTPMEEFLMIWYYRFATKILEKES